MTCGEPRKYVQAQWTWERSDERRVTPQNQSFSDRQTSVILLGPLNRTESPRRFIRIFDKLANPLNLLRNRCPPEKIDFNEQKNECL